MSNLVIVAIPDENDRVWKVSSEEIPHLTICFLGDTDQVANVEQIVGFVEHAANTTLNRFYMSVDRRGELGNDPELGPADVLFFKKNRYDYKAIRDFRASLLQDDNIRTAYDSSTQHDGVWVPHLTLGYENRPAKPEDNDMGSSFYSVDFNKIAVWLDNYDGPEFLLKDYWDEFEALESVPMDVAMSDIQHYGVKGMHWGVRRDDLAGATKSVGRAAGSAGGAVSKAAKATSRFVKDVNFESQVESGKARERVMESAQKDFRKEDLPAVKSRHGDYGKLLNRAKKPLSKEARAYRKDAKETYIKRLETTANSMTNATGNRQYTVRERGIELPASGGNLPSSKYYWDVSSREVHHADNGVDFTRVELIMDDEGWITDLKKIAVEDSMAQTADLGADFLEHFGVKGMQWGVRNVRGSDSEGRSRVNPDFQKEEGRTQAHDSIALAAGVLVPIVSPLSVPAAIRTGARIKRTIGESKVERQDSKFERKAGSVKTMVDVHNGAVDGINKSLGPINKRYNVDLTDPKNSAQRRKYDQEVLNMMSKEYQKSANAITSKSGNLQYDIKMRGNDTFAVKAKKIKHAVEDEEEILLGIVRAPTGHVINFAWPEMAQSVVDIGATLVSSLFDSETLEHYGVKGMHWGQRREPPSAVAPSAMSRVPHGAKRKTQIDVAGGENHPASEDAIKVAQSKIKLARSGPAALTNKELQEVANRVELEQRVKRAVQPAGRKFVGNLLRQEGQQGTQQLFRKGVKKGGRGVRKVALGF